MLDIHGRLRHTKGEADPLKHVADDVAAGVKVRCVLLLLLLRHFLLMHFARG
jgi:hypothetical protein